MKNIYRSVALELFKIKVDSKCFESNDIQKFRGQLKLLDHNKTRNFNAKVSAGEGKAFIGVVDTYTENKPVNFLVTKM